MVALTSFFSTIAVAALASVPSLAMYSRGSAVKQLDTSNFDRILARTSQPTFVKFYAPWCGHCKNLEPEYERAAKRSQGIAKFYAVNCDEDKNRGLCAQFNVQGFPTLKVFTEKRTKRGKRRSVDYQGERKTAAMVKFVRSMLPNLSKKVASDGLDQFVSKGSLPKAVLLSERTKTGELWKGVSARFDSKVAFAQVSNPSQSVRERLGITQLPAIAVFPSPADPNAFELYSGDLKYLPLAQYISDLASGKIKVQAGSDASEDSKAEPEVEAESNDTATKSPAEHTVEEIATQADLMRLCIDQTASSIVPVLCIIGVVPLEPEFEESRVEHQQALSELQAVLRDQPLRGPSTPDADKPASKNDDDYDDDDDADANANADNATKALAPFRASWVNALGEAGKQIRTMFSLSDDLPSAVIINARRSAAAPYRGAFTKDGILQWANECYRGQHMRRFQFELDISGTAAQSKESEQESPAHDEL
ncbi:hypothetical protein GGI07_004027 [Coemansia sp. Benny D115]|nr:hypothetical protein GGI07_004027 [Coemansia sp. Benny D115]